MNWSIAKKDISLLLVLLSSMAFGEDIAHIPSVYFSNEFGVWTADGYRIKLEQNGVIRISRYNHWECRFTSDHGQKVSELSSLIPQEYKKFSSIGINYCADNHQQGVSFLTTHGDFLDAHWAVDKDCRNGKEIPGWLVNVANEMAVIYESTKGKCNNEMVMIHFSNLKELSKLQELEAKLTVVLEESGIGQYEGFDILSDAGDGVLYLYGKSADNLFNSILPILKNTMFLKKGAAARLIYEFSTESERNRLVVLSAK